MTTEEIQEVDDGNFPTTQDNSTPEELVEQLAEIFVEAWMIQKAQEEGERGEYFRERLRAKQIEEDLANLKR